MEGNLQWELLSYVCNDFDASGRTQAVQVRWARSGGGRRVFSYVVGLLTKADPLDTNEEPEWSPYKYIPDRFVSEYIGLLNRAALMVQDAIKKAEMSLETNFNTGGLKVKLNEIISAR